MLARVGQRLLHHPVSRELGALGQRSGRPEQRERHRHARVASLADQLARSGRDRAPAPAGLLIPGAQHAEQPPHLGQRLPPGLRDRGQRLPGPLRLGAQRVARAVGLHHHHADVVRDHVVQLTGDPGPLGRGGDLRLRAALPLQPRRSVLQRGFRYARRYRIESPSTHATSAVPLEITRASRTRLTPPTGRPHPHHNHGPRPGQGNQQPRDRHAARAVGGQGVQQHQGRQQRAARAAAGHQVDRQRAAADHERLDRVSAPEHYGDRHRRDQRQLQRGVDLQRRRPRPAPRGRTRARRRPASDAGSARRTPRTRPQRRRGTARRRPTES